MTCGEGGALAIADPELAARAEIIREKGTNRSAFLRGEVDKYTWVAEGSSYVLSDVLAAVLDAQLDKLDAIQARRRGGHGALPRAGFGDWAARARRAPAARAARPRAQPPLFYLLYPTPRARDRALAALRAGGVLRDLPLRAAALLAATGAAWAGEPALPVTDRVARALAAPAAAPAPDRRRRGARDRRRAAARGLSARPAPPLSLVLACYNEEETSSASFAEIRDDARGHAAARSRSSSWTT